MQARTRGSHIDFEAVFAALPTAAAVFAPDPPHFTVLAASDALCAISGRPRAALVGRPLAQAFLNASPDDPQATGLRPLQASLAACLQTGSPHRMQRQRYDLQRPDGVWEARYWEAVNTPVPGPDGAVRYLLHQTMDITAQVLGEAARAQAERRADGLIERMGDAHCVLDREFRIVGVNAAAERLLGRRRETLLGRSHWDVFPESVDAPVGRAFRRVVAEGVEQHLAHHYTGEGYDLYLEVDAYPTEESGLVMFWRDVTERVRAEQALRESEEKYRALFTQMDEAYAVVEVLADEAGRWTDFLFLEVNPAFMRHTGMPYPVGRTATQLLGTPNPRWAELYGHAAQTGESIRLEESELTLGRVFDLNIFRLGGEGCRRVAVLFTDITERRRAEDALRESERRHRLLFENISEGFALAEMIWDADGRPLDWRYLEVNDAWAQTGVPVSQTVGRTAREVNSWIEPYWIETYARVVETGQAVAYENHVVGFGKWFDTLAFKHSENCFGLLLRDVTERKRAEQARRRSEERQAFLLKLADALRPLAAPADIQGAATRLLREHFALGWCYYAEFDEAGTAATVLQDAVRDGLPSLAGRHDLRDIPEYVAFLRTGRLVDVPDFAHYELITPRVVAQYTGMGVRSMLGTALVKQGRLLAQLVMLDTTPRQWPSEAVDLIQEVAERTWAAVELARTQRRTHELNAFLVRFSEAVRGVSDATEVGRTACRLVAQELGVDRAYWAEVDAATREYVVGASFEVPGAVAVSGRFAIDAWEPLSGLHQRGLPVVVDDTQRDDRLALPLKQGYAQLGIGADIAAPVTVAGSLRACLAVNQALPRHWRQEEVALVQGVAARCWTEVERARAAASLRASEGRLKAITDLVPDLLWRSNATGATEWVNQRWCEYTGDALEDALGDRWHAMVHPEDLPRVRESLQSAMAAGTQWQNEHRLRRFDGQWCWHLVRAEPVHDEAGVVQQWFGAATDIHQQRAGREELQQQVVERTLALRHLLLRTEGLLDDERRRIARELHDNLGQYLTSVGLAVSGLKEAPVDGETRARLHRLHEVLQKLDQELDRMIFILRPTALDDCGLGDGVAAYVQTWSTVTGIPADMELQGLDGGRLPPDIEGAIFRVVQEALNNVAKYASASQVSVSLVRRTTLLFGSVEDDGCGFDVEQPAGALGPAPRWGLMGMQERIEALGGRFDVESQPGRGTSVQWQLPLGGGRGS